MYQMIYISTAAHPFSSAELVELLRKSRANNAGLGISGLLLYEKLSFMQVLEGPQASVTALYEKISRDPRHTDILVLAKSEIEQPSFADWGMGFVDLNDRSTGALPGFTDVFSDESSFSKLRGHADRARKLLLQFRDGRWRREVQCA